MLVSSSANPESVKSRSASAVRWLSSGFVRLRLTNSRLCLRLGSEPLTLYTGVLISGSYIIDT